MKNGKRTFLFLLPQLITFACLAQLQPVYVFQKDDTVVRHKYYEQTQLKKKDLYGSLEKEYAKDYKKIYDDQFGSISDFWQSSRIVTEPQAHAYLQSIVQKIISANPELKGNDARVVFCRDEIPNAYSMGDGTIAINAGLLLYMENEAQLVFTICHELAHYYLNHMGKAIKKYVETINSESFKQEVKRLSKEEYRVGAQIEKLAKTIVFDRSRHSRDNETDADRHAFLFMKRTGYDCNQARTMLELLDKVDDSLILAPLVLEPHFTFADYPFRKRWTQKQSAIFAQVSGNDSPLTQQEKDSLKTHPDCSKRIVMLADSIRLQPAGKLFMINENMFRRLKKEFLVEITEQMYREEHLSRNLYYSLLMLQQDVNTSFAIYSIARCLNDLYESQRDHTLGLKVGTESRIIPADYNLLLRMLNRVKLDEIGALSHRFCKRYEAQMKGIAGFDKELARARRFDNQSSH